MRLEELKEGVVYSTDIGYVFKLEDQKLLIRDMYYNEWTEAIKLLPITALAGFIYEEVKEIEAEPVFTEEEKELARCALKLGIKVIVKEGDDFYCSADDDIWMGEFGSWENNNGIWFGDDELPLLLKSFLVEKVKENEPLYLEDVVK